ncbi:MAG: hypothetical protein SGPRY_007394 [Prymnesium sp.]
MESRLDTSPENVSFSNWSRKLVRAGQAGFRPEARLRTEEMFSLLREADGERGLLNKNYLMGASIGGLGGEVKRRDGLVEGHAYSLIRAVSAELPNAEPLRLLQLRNPWGNQQEWRGAWSDNSQEWRKYKEVTRQLQRLVRADGLFWMSWADFSAIFTNVEICRKSMPFKRASFEDLGTDFSSRHKPQESRRLQCGQVASRRAVIGSCIGGSEPSKPKEPATARPAAHFQRNKPRKPVILPKAGMKFRSALDSRRLPCASGAN